MHPVGPRSSGVYWVRRALLAAVVVVVLVGVVWWVVGRAAGPAAAPTAATVSSTPPQLTGVLATATSTAVTDDASVNGSGNSGATTGSSVTGASAGSPSGLATGSGTSTAIDTSAHGTSGPSATSGTSMSPTAGASVASDAAKATGTAAEKKPATTTKAPATTAKSSASATKTTAPPAPSYDASGNLICPDTSVTVAAITVGGSVFPVGSQPRLGMTVTNTGRVSCVRDVSGALQVYTVRTAAGERVWSTADCFPGTGHEVRQFAPGSSASFVIVWSGTTSQPGCSAPRARVAPGAYTLVAQLGALSSKPLPFTMR